MLKIEHSNWLKVIRWLKTVNKNAYVPALDQDRAQALGTFFEVFFLVPPASTIISSHFKKGKQPPMTILRTG